MQKIQYNNFIRDWSALFSEFLASEDFDQDNSDDNLAYPFLGDFSRFLMKKVEAADASKDPIVQRVFDAINAQFEIDDADPETLNLLGVELFENLVGTEKGMQIAREKLLSPKAIESFNLSAQEYGVLGKSVLVDSDGRRIVYDFTHITVTEPNGETWNTERISFDGFRDLELAGTSLSGLSYDPMNKNEEWVPFSLNLNTKELTGGSYPEYLKRNPVK